MQRLSRWNLFRIIPVFITALCVGLWSAGSFHSRYYVSLYVEKRFTRQEAEAWVGKKVLINQPTRQPQIATVVGYYPENDFPSQLVTCCITIERNENAKNIWLKDQVEEYLTVVENP